MLFSREVALDVREMLDADFSCSFSLAQISSPSALQISLLGDFRSARLLEASLEAYEAKGGK